MKSDVQVTVEIPFHDVDSLNIVWHGHYYKYFEIARTALYRSKGFDIKEMVTEGLVFPVIESGCRYIKALKYGQQIEVSAKFVVWQHYIKINYTISDLNSGVKSATGFTKQAACLPDGAMLLAIPERVIHVIET